MRRPAAASRAVLVTGCSSGIGRETALALVRTGEWRVWATARRRESLADLEGAGCRTLALDVTDEASMTAAVATVEAEDGAVSALVNNAGYQQTGALEGLAIDQVRQQFETNLFGLLRLIQLVAPGMRRQGWGRIVNLSSMGGRMSLPGGGAYHASKHALEALSDVLRFETAPFGIDVVVIEPGLISTGFTTAAVDSIHPAQARQGPYAAFNASIPEIYAGMGKGLSRLIVSGPETVARTIVRALAAKRPRTRYKVSPSARIFIWTRRLVSDRMWDRIIAGIVPPPRPAR